jgi:hypothetical protein
MGNDIFQRGEQCRRRALHWAGWSGNVYVTGVLEYSEGGSSDDWGTIKYDSTGAEQWVRIYDGPAGIADEAWSIAVDVNGNSYVLATATDLPQAPDLTSIKYDTDGVRNGCRHTIVRRMVDTGFDIAVDSQGNV